MALLEQDIKRVKGLGFLLNRGTEEFSGRIITENGILTAKQMQCLSEAAEKFGNGNITLPTDISATAMSEWELCDLFGVTAPTFRAGLKALCKSGVLREYGIRRSIRVSDNCSMEVYNLEAIVALAFHIGTFGAERVRNAVLERLYLRKEKTSIFFSLNTNGISKSEYFS